MRQETSNQSKNDDSQIILTCDIGRHRCTVEYLVPTQVFIREGTVLHKILYLRKLHNKLGTYLVCHIINCKIK